MSFRTPRERSLGHFRYWCFQMANWWSAANDSCIPLVSLVLKNPPGFFLRGKALMESTRYPINEWGCFQPMKIANYESYSFFFR